MANLAIFFHYPGAEVSRINEADINETVALINAAYSYMDTHKGHPRTSPDGLRATAGKNDFYVAKQGHEIVGCVYLKPEEKSVHFGLLAVIDRLRGKGLGPALIKAVEAYAKHLDANKVELDYMSVAPWLKAYYERHGYAETGEVIHWGNIDLIRMTKTLRGKMSS